MRQSGPNRIALDSSTLVDWLAGHARATPDRPALICSSGALSWCDLSELVFRLSGWLQAQKWFEVGARVVLCLPNSREYVAAYFAVLQSGGIVTPVNPKAKPAEIGYICEQLEPALFVGSAQSVAALDASGHDRLPALIVGASNRQGCGVGTSWEEAAACSGVEAPSIDPDATSVIAFSSGTTGRPKGCMLSLRMLSAQVAAWSTWVGLNHGSASLISLPLFHVAGMQTGMNASVHVGSTMVLGGPWDVPGFVALSRKHRLTHWVGTTTMAVDLVGDPLAAEADYSSFRMMGGGGAPMPDALAQRFRTLTGHDYIDGYGLTETSGAVLLNPAGAPGRGSVGKPVFNCRVEIADPETGAVVPTGQVGEVVVDDPSVFSGYWRCADESERAFRDVPGLGRMFRTGDIGRRDHEGRFYLVDRLKRLISVSGQKVSPSEVEAVLSAHPEIAECCVVSCPDARHGEAVKAFVVLRGASALDLDEVHAWCGDKLSSYKWPRKLELVEGLPRSETGKVSWKVLQDREWAA